MDLCSLSEEVVIVSIRRIIGLFCLALFLSYSISPPCIAAAAPEYRNTAEAARESIWKAITSGGASSATVAVMDGGKIVYSEVFGAADRKSGRNVDKSTRFNIGSVSKMFAATALLILADEGKISLDDPVVSHIPEFTMSDDRYREITIRMLMNHSSGLPGSSFFFGYKPYGDTHKMLLERLKESSLKYSPGMMGVYCNDGFALAEMIVERTTGQNFIDFLSKRVFQPLEMNDTYASVGETSGNIAHFYAPQTGEKFPPEVILVHAVGGLSSTAEDLCRFADSFCPGGKKILSEHSLEEIFKIQPTSFASKFHGAPLFEAFGWDYLPLPAYASLGIGMYSKIGDTGTYSTGLQIIPKKRLAVAVSLSGKISGESVARPVVDGLLKDKGLPVPPKSKKGKPAEPEIIPPDLDIFEGIYTNGDNFVKIKFNADRKGMKITRIVSDSDRGSQKAAEEAAIHFVYSGGSFLLFEKEFSGYFLKDGENLFFVSENDPLYGLDVLMCQSVPKLADPKKLFTDINGRLWLIRNLPPTAQLYGESNLVVRSSTFKELPGHLVFMSPLKVADERHATYAAPFFRDQSELSIFDKEGLLWAKTNIFLLSEAAVARNIKPGRNPVIIGGEGYNEWRRVESGTLLSFDLPPDGRVIVVTEYKEYPVIYDSIVSRDEAYAPAGSFVVCFGRPGDIFMIDTE